MQKELRVRCIWVQGDLLDRQEIHQALLEFLQNTELRKEMENSLMKDREGSKRRGVPGHEYSDNSHGSRQVQFIFKLMLQERILTNFLAQKRAAYL
jgi:hypothetical protein